MKAIVVYESHWGNTAAVARAIAEGIGSEAQALSTAEATGEALSGVELIVAGAPLLGFSLPTERMLKGLAANAIKDPTPPDTSHPSMRAWLDRDAHLVVAGQRGEGDLGQAGGRGLPPGRQSPAFHRAGQVRPAACR